MVANYKQVLARYHRLPEEIRYYFNEFEPVFERSWEVIASYVFLRVEAAKHMTIYCGIVKLHKTDSALTRSLVDRDHMSRDRFKKLFKTVFGKEIDKALLAKLASAEKIRDKIVHGKVWTNEEARTALNDVLDFAAEFNSFVNETAGFRPFSDLRGFKGAAKSLSKETTHWVLRGMGIPPREQAGTDDPAA